MGAPDPDPRLADVLDKAELHELAMRYSRGVDRADRELLLSVYHPDAIDHHGDGFRGGPTAFADWVEGALARFEVTAHYIMNTSYRIEGDAAEGELYFIAYHRTLPPESQTVTVGGRYLDRYQRRDGAWKIVHRTLVWDWSELTGKDEASMKFLRELGVSGGREEDPSYAELPRFAPGAG